MKLERYDGAGPCEHCDEHPTWLLDDVALCSGCLLDALGLLPLTVTVDFGPER